MAIKFAINNATHLLDIVPAFAQKHQQNKVETSTINMCKYLKSLVVHKHCEH